MLWFSRTVVLLLGLLAWLVSYALADVSMGSNAPPWLIPGILLFAATYFVGGVASLVAEYRDTKRRDRRDLKKDAFTLARDMEMSIDKRFLMGTDLIVEDYGHHFADRAAEIATRFRSQKVPQTDLFFALAEHGANDFTEVFNVKEGANRLARQLKI